MEITDELVKKLAHLSRLQFSESESSGIKADLQKMIGFIDKLNEVDTAGVEPLLHITPNKNILRSDEPSAPVDPGTFTKDAPGADAQYFRVPKVIKK